MRRVVEDEDAEADEVEDVAEQDCSGDYCGVGVPAETVDVAGDERDEAHGDGSADAVATGRDEHAEVGGEHEAHLVGAEWLSEGDGEGAGYVGGDALEGQVDEDVEDVGDGIDEPHQHDGEERGAEETGASEEQDDAGSVGEGYEGVRRYVDGPLRARG